MGTEYTRQSTYTDGDTITAAHTNDEFDRLLSVFDATNGHTHDGTSAEGGPITKLLGSGLQFGAGTASSDITITFNTSGNDGELKWLQSDNRFQFSNDIIVVDDKQLIFGTNTDVAVSYDETTTNSLKIAATEGAGLAITLMADEGDDAGDEWKLNIADGGTLTLGNDINSAGTYVTHLTITPNSTVANSTMAVAGNLTVGGSLTLGSGAVLAEAELEMLDGITAGTVIASKALVADANIDITGGRNITITGNMVIGGDIDLEGGIDVNGTLEADAITIDGVTLAETIADTVGAMVTSNTESGITVTYDDADNTLDFTVGTLNQNTTGSAATLTTARNIGGTSFDGSANIAVGLAATATALATARNIGGTSFDGTGDIAVALASVGTAVTVADESSDTTCFPLFTTAATGDLPPKSGSNLTFNSSSGLLTATSFAGNLTGDVTGNADTATVATTVTITDNESENEDNAIIFTAGGDVDGGNIGLESDGTMTYNPSTGKITATGFIGALTGNVTGNLTGTVSTATQNSITTATGLTSVGALASGSIASGFGTIDTGSSAITTTGVITGGTVEVTTDTAAGDNAAIGYTAGEGLILTGQGSTTDVTIKNDADATVASIATGTTIFTLNDDAFVTGRAAGTQTASAASDNSVMDLRISNYWTVTPDSDDTITLSNPAIGQAGIIFLDNSAGRNLSAHASILINADVLSALDTAGKYMLSYYCTATSGDNTILMSATGALT